MGNLKAVIFQVDLDHEEIYRIHDHEFKDIIKCDTHLSVANAESGRKS